MDTITKKDLVESVAAATKTNRSVVRVVLQEFLDQIVHKLKKGHRLEFRDFGVFEVRQRRARLAQNPKTLEPIQVRAKRTVRFKCGRHLKNVVDAAPTVEAKPMSAAAAVR